MSKSVRERSGKPTASLPATGYTNPDGTGLAPIGQCNGKPLWRDFRRAARPELPAGFSVRRTRVLRHSSAIASAVERPLDDADGRHALYTVSCRDYCSGDFTQDFDPASAGPFGAFAFSGPRDPSIST